VPEPPGQGSGRRLPGVRGTFEVQVEAGSGGTDRVEPDEMRPVMHRLARIWVGRPS